MFEKRLSEARFLNPLKGFKMDAQPIEYRKDFFTKRWCRINIERATRLKQAQSARDSNIIKKSAEKCFFCPSNFEISTPRLPPEIAPEGRIKLGETLIFPNLFPFAQYHAVGAITKEHFLRLDEFEQKHIANALEASIDYFKRVYSYDKNAKYPSFNWNNLFPSGASIVHPHVQLVADSEPPYLTDVYLKASTEYYSKHKENYWLKLVKEEERMGERFIGRTGSIAWFTSFVPIGNNEVNAVFEDCSSLTDLSIEQISDFSRGMKNVLTAFSKMGIQSFNLATYSGAINEKTKGFYLSMKVISRPYPRSNYTNDAGFMEVMHQERIVESLPEKVAGHIRKFFQ